MKKIIIFIFCFLFINNVYGSTTIQKGTFSKCVDGDTAYFIVDGKEEKFRFLAIDTPETVSTTVSEEPFGKDASDFVWAIFDFMFPNYKLHFYKRGNMFIPHYLSEK